MTGYKDTLEKPEMLRISLSGLSVSFRRFYLPEPQIVEKDRSYGGILAVIFD